MACLLVWRPARPHAGRAAREGSANKVPVVAALTRHLVASHRADRPAFARIRLDRCDRGGLPCPLDFVQGGPRMAANARAASVVWNVSRELWESIEPILMKEGTPKPGAPPLAVAASAEGQTVAVVEDPFYIVAPSPQADEQNRVLNHGDTLAVFDHHGDIRPAGRGEERPH